MDQTRKKQSKNLDNIQLKDPNQKLNPTSKDMTHKYLFLAGSLAEQPLSSPPVHCTLA